jgi:membrane-associated protease RseP (regulator of RpoE activity)
MRRIVVGMFALWWLVAPVGLADDLELSEAEVAEQRARLASLGLERMFERQQRLTRVSSQVRYRGAALCEPRWSRVLGIVAASAAEIPAVYRETAYQRYGIDDLVKVIWVLPGYPAADAGLEAGDTILEIDGREIHLAAALERRRAEDLPIATLLRIERDGEIRDLQVESRIGCFRPAEVKIMDNIDAYSEGERIVVYSGLLRFLESDDELAVILGHELAHGLLDAGLDPAAAEREADRVGLYLAALAGYDVAVARGLSERFIREFPLALEARTGHTHLSSPERALALEATTSEIQAKLDRGEPLEPELR